MLPGQKLLTSKRLPRAVPDRTYQNSRSHGSGDDSPPPDFAALAERLRPLFREVDDASVATNRQKLRSLAKARSFLILARRYRAEFFAVAKEHGIKAGRLETRVIRYLYGFEPVEGWTSVGQWADRLVWMAERCEGLSDSEAVKAAISVGGLTKIGRVQQAARATARAKSYVTSSPTFLEWVLAKLDEYEPDDSPAEPNTVSVRIEFVDPNGKPHLYARIPVESVIRAAVNAMRHLAIPAR